MTDSHDKTCKMCQYKEDIVSLLDTLINWYTETHDRAYIHVSAGVTMVLNIINGDDMKRLLIDENPGREVTFRVV